VSPRIPETGSLSESYSLRAYPGGQKERGVGEGGIGFMLQYVFIPHDRFRFDYATSVIPTEAAERVLNLSLAGKKKGYSIDYIAQIIAFPLYSPAPALSSIPLPETCTVSVLYLPAPIQLSLNRRPPDSPSSDRVRY